MAKNGAEPGDVCEDANGPYPQFSDLNPVDGTTDTVHVCVRRQSPAIFSKLGGISYVWVSAKAGAMSIAQPALYSIFANNPCPHTDPNLTFSGSNNTVTGDMHSNCNISFGGNDSTFDGFVTNTGTVQGLPDPSNTCNGGACNPIPTGSVPMPINYVYADVPCTPAYDFTGSGDIDLSNEPSVWMDFTTKDRLKSGVYCNETGKLVLSGTNVTSEPGGVTFAAWEVNLNGSNFNLEPNWYGTDPIDNPTPMLALGFSDAIGIDTSGSGGIWNGAMYAPNGLAKIAGGAGLAINGSIIADEIEISGGDVTFVGNISGVGTIRQIYLIE